MTPTMHVRPSNTHPLPAFTGPVISGSSRSAATAARRAATSLRSLTSSPIVMPLIMPDRWKCLGPPMLVTTEPVGAGTESDRKKAQANYP